MPPNCHPVKRRVCEGFEREGEPKRSAERVVKVQQEVASKDVEGCCVGGGGRKEWPELDLGSRAVGSRVVIQRVASHL
jgi:hypothetical protein